MAKTVSGQRLHTEDLAGLTLRADIDHWWLRFEPQDLHARLQAKGKCKIGSDEMPVELNFHASRDDLAISDADIRCWPREGSSEEFLAVNLVFHQRALDAISDRAFAAKQSFVVFKVADKNAGHPAQSLGISGVHLAIGR